MTLWSFTFTINHWLLDKALPHLPTAYYPIFSYPVSVLLRLGLYKLPALRLALRLLTACQALSSSPTAHASFHPAPCQRCCCQPNLARLHQGWTSSSCSFPAPTQSYPSFPVQQSPLGSMGQRNGSLLRLQECKIQTAATDLQSLIPYLFFS